MGAWRTEDVKVVIITKSTSEKVDPATFFLCFFEDSVWNKSARHCSDFSWNFYGLFNIAIMYCRHVLAY